MYPHDDIRAQFNYIYFCIISFYSMACRLHHLSANMASSSPHTKAPLFPALPRLPSPQLDTPRFATLGSKPRQEYASPSRLSSNHIRSSNHAEQHPEPYRSPAHAARVSAVEGHLRTSLHDPARELLDGGDSLQFRRHQAGVTSETSRLSYGSLDQQDQSAYNSLRGLGAQPPQSPVGSRLGLHSQYGHEAISSLGALPSSPLGSRLGPSQSQSGPHALPSSPLVSRRQSQYGLAAVDMAQHASSAYSPYSPSSKPYQGLHAPARLPVSSHVPHNSPDLASHARPAESSLLSHTQRQQRLSELDLLSHMQRQQPAAELDSLSRRLLEQRLGQGRAAYSGLNSPEAPLGRARQDAKAMPHDVRYAHCFRGFADRTITAALLFIFPHAPCCRQNGKVSHTPAHMPINAL